jgi:Na+-transporting NADH:ubiquinone oxidoreductase subunit NqrB
MAIDARLYQILFLSCFLFLGILARDWTLHPSHIAVAIGSCLLTQSVCLWVSRQKSEAERVNWTPSDFYSPLITALGLSLLLRVDHAWTMAIAGTIAVLSKFCLQINGKHLFNPANFGIVAVLLFTQKAWVSPGQWGESFWLMAIFLGCGGLVLQKVGRWDTTIAFLGSYIGLEALRNLYLGWTWDVLGHRLMSGSLLMFALFMITDPRTIPNSRLGRILWASLIALVTFILRNLFYVHTAVFWALFIIAPLTVLFDQYLTDDRFDWAMPPTPQLWGSKIRNSFSGLS